MNEEPKLPTPAKPVGMSFEQARHYTGLGRSTLYKLAKQGRIEIRKVGRRSLLIRTQLDELVTGRGLSDAA
ncbi:MAG: excisionase family DNA-binding protein [Aestuariivirga sp.]